MANEQETNNSYLYASLINSYKAMMACGPLLHKQLASSKENVINLLLWIGPVTMICFKRKNGYDDDTSKLQICFEIIIQMSILTLTISSCFKINPPSSEKVTNNKCGDGCTGQTNSTQLTTKRKNRRSTDGVSKALKTMTMIMNQERITTNKGFHQEALNWVKENGFNKKHESGVSGTANLNNSTPGSPRLLSKEQRMQSRKQVKNFLSRAFGGSTTATTKVMIAAKENTSASGAATVHPGETQQQSIAASNPCINEDRDAITTSTTRKDGGENQTQEGAKPDRESNFADRVTIETKSTEKLQTSFAVATATPKGMASIAAMKGATNFKNNTSVASASTSSSSRTLRSSMSYGTTTRRQSRFSFYGSSVPGAQSTSSHCKSENETVGNGQSCSSDVLTRNAVQAVHRSVTRQGNPTSTARRMMVY